MQMPHFMKLNTHTHFPPMPIPFRTGRVLR